MAEAVSMQAEIGDSAVDRRLRDFWTSADVARLLSLSPKTIYSLCDQLAIPHYRVGGSIRFDPDEIIEWIRACKVVGTGRYNSTVTITRSPRKGGKR